MQHSLIKKIGLSKEKDGLCESLEGEVYIVFFFFLRHKLVLDITIKLNFLVIEAILITWKRANWFFVDNFNMF